MSVSKCWLFLHYLSNFKRWLFGQNVSSFEQEVHLCACLWLFDCCTFTALLKYCLKSNFFTNKAEWLSLQATVLLYHHVTASLQVRVSDGARFTHHFFFYNFNESIVSQRFIADYYVSLYHIMLLPLLTDLGFA